MNPDVILRIPSFIVANIEGSVRVVDMRNNIKVAYSYLTEVRNKLLLLEIIKVSEIITESKYKEYELTDKGKEIQGHLRGIIDKLKEVR